jgi:hypothetical protein
LLGNLKTGFLSFPTFSMAPLGHCDESLKYFDVFRIPEDLFVLLLKPDM